MFSRILRWLGHAPNPYSNTESDAEADRHQAHSRATGGLDEHSCPDAHSTTGPGRNAEFVGRVAGEDAGHIDDDAERRYRSSRTW